MREVARMTGVVMEAHGPGVGPTTPMELVYCLRKELGLLNALAGSHDDAITRAVLLDDHGLTPCAYDLACEYALPVGGAPRPLEWMPTWTRMRADEIRDRTFAALMDGNSQERYVASRRFLIEHPAGGTAELRELVSETEVRPPERGYREIPADHSYAPVGGERWWWPCGVCRWPMAVKDRTVRCRYVPHAAVYRIRDARRAVSPPTLNRTDDGRPHMPTPQPRPAAGSQCVEFGVWRFIVVPGVSELRVASTVEKLGATVELWPARDRYDLRVLTGNHELEVDLKEYRSPHRLIADLRARQPHVRILLPKTHEHQLETVRTALPNLWITTETKFRTEVRRAMKTAVPT
jgi:hypothetical protein